MTRLAFALAACLAAACVRKELPLDRIVGTYEHRDRFAGTRVRLMPDGTFVLVFWHCKGSESIRGRWVQEHDGVLRLSGGGDAAPAPEPGLLGGLCSADPSVCPMIALEQIQLRVLPDSLEVLTDADAGAGFRLPRVK